MRSWALPGLLLAGCSGKEGREIPMWQDGVLTQGDCPAEEDIAAVDSVGLTTPIHRGPLYLDYEDPLQDPVGIVVTDDQSYYDTMVELNFDAWTIVDFTRDQAGFVWYRTDSTCGIEFQEIHIVTKKDGGTVLEVTLKDASLGCADTCAGQEDQYLVIQAFPNAAPGSVCRKITPGCPP